eukprot:SAG11_NODE_396_length_9806_cov_37.601855_6_plen_150_part_00
MPAELSAFTVHAKAVPCNMPSSVQWLVALLEIRDYFCYSALRLGAQLFALHPNPRQRPRPGKQKAAVRGSTVTAAARWRRLDEPLIHSVAEGGEGGVVVGSSAVVRSVRGCLISGAEAFRRWALGRTGLPLIDAGMRELLATGDRRLPP